MRRMLTLLIAGLIAWPAFGWGRDGHAIIAAIAWKELSPAAQASITELLEGASLEEIASWADAVRPQDEYRWSAPLHYVNMPADASAYDHERDCPEVGCVVSAIDRFAREVADESLPLEARREALMFLVHFVGDLHQPLHGGRAEDRGGNDIEILFYGRPTNLHRAWDSQILEAFDGSPWPTIEARLYASINAVDRVAWLADYHDEDLIATAGRWAYESHKLAEVYCYGKVSTGDEVERAYVDETIAVVLTRLSQGGVRLGAVLESALGEETGQDVDTAPSGAG
ncbi:MAG: S1/P1 nuclease [Phycisphaerales bacterium]